MGRSQETWSKKEREKKKQKDKKDKAEKKLERKQNASGSKSLEDMMCYVDEYGNLTDTPPDKSKKVEVKLEDIVIGVPKAEDMDPEDAFHSGTVTFFNEAKGFGFIKDSRNGESVFVHVNSCNDRIGEHSKVKFELERGPKGWQAANVSLVKE